MKKLSFLVVFLLVFSPFLASGGSIFPSGPDHSKFAIDSLREKAFNPKKRTTNNQSSREKRKQRQLEQRVEKLERESRKKISTGSYKWNVFTRQFERVK